MCVWGGFSNKFVYLYGKCCNVEEKFMKSPLSMLKMCVRVFVFENTLIIVCELCMHVCFYCALSFNVVGVSLQVLNCVCVIIFMCIKIVS